MNKEITNQILSTARAYETFTSKLNELENELHNGNIIASSIIQDYWEAYEYQYNKLKHSFALDYANSIK